MQRPVFIDDRAVAASSVYSSEAGPLPPDREAASLLAANQVAGVLQSVVCLPRECFAIRIVLAVSRHAMNSICDRS